MCISVTCRSILIQPLANTQIILIPYMVQNCNKLHFYRTFRFCQKNLPCLAHNAPLKKHIWQQYSRQENYLNASSRGSFLGERIKDVCLNRNQLIESEKNLLIIQYDSQLVSLSKQRKRSVGSGRQVAEWEREEEKSNRIVHIDKGIHNILEPHEESRAPKIKGLQLRLALHPFTMSCVNLHRVILCTGTLTKSCVLNSQRSMLPL